MKYKMLLVAGHQREALRVAAGLEREGVPKPEARRRACSMVRRGYGLPLRRREKG